MTHDMDEEGYAFNHALINLLGLIGRLADSDDERLRITSIPFDMRNIRIELDAGKDDGAGNCVIYLLESDGAAVRLATQGADPAEDYRDFGIAGSDVDSALHAAVSDIIPKIVTRAGRDTTRNMNVTLAMFEEKP